MTIDKYLRVSQVCEYTGLSRATIYSMEKNDEFPRKIALGKRAIAWLESDVCKWMESRKSVTKVGREAKPGRPTTKPGKANAMVTKIQNASGAPNPPAISAPNLPPPIPNTVSIDDIWDDNDPTPIVEKATGGVRGMRSEANKDIQPKTDIVKRTHKMIVLNTRKPNQK